MAKRTIHFRPTWLITPSLDSEEDFSSGRRNVNQEQQFFSEIPSPTTTDHNCSSYLRLLDDAFHGKGTSRISFHGIIQELVSRAQVVMDIPHGVWTLCTRVWSWDTLRFDFDRLIIANNQNVSEDYNDDNIVFVTVFGARSEWLILGHSSVMAAGTKCLIRNNLSD